jgi:hypothetical protein
MNAQAYYRSVRADRNAWRDEMPQRCMKCRHKFSDHIGSLLWPEIHEILSRAQAPNNWGFRANYLLLCNKCHHGWVPTASHAAQLSLKLACDKRHYDLREWLRRRNPNAMEYVTEDEVRRAS